MTSNPEGREGACQDTVRGVTGRVSVTELEMIQHHDLPVYSVLLLFLSFILQKERLHTTLPIRAELPVAPDSHRVPVTSPKQDVKDESDVC